MLMPKRVHNKKLSEAQSGIKHRMYGKHHTEETKQKMSENHADFTGANNPSARKVMCINNGLIFDTVKEAANWSSTGKSSIANQIRGKYKYAGRDPMTYEKLQWQYIESIKDR